MRPNKKPFGIVLEGHNQQRLTYVGAKRAGQASVAEYIRKHGWAGGASSVRLVRPPGPGFMVSAAQRSTLAFEPVNKTDLPEDLFIPEGLVVPTIVSIGNIVSMPWVPARIHDIKPAHALGMLNEFWEFFPTPEDLPPR